MTTPNDNARFTLYVNKRKHAKVFQFLQTLPDGSVANYLRDLVLEDIARRESASRLPLDLTPAQPRRSRRNAVKKGQGFSADPSPNAGVTGDSSSLEHASQSTAEIQREHESAHVWRWPNREPFKKSRRS